MNTQIDMKWLKACRIEDAIENGGVCLKLNNEQVALFYFARRNEWYATQKWMPAQTADDFKSRYVGVFGRNA